MSRMRSAWLPGLCLCPLGRGRHSRGKVACLAHPPHTEDVNQCVALETTRVRQRIAIEIWSNYQDYICARLKFADPTPDKQRANEDEAVTNAAEQELHAQRYAIQAYLHRTHQPLELGV